MTIRELHKKFTKGELTTTQGDMQLRYEAFAPLFSNLYENKVVYHERFTCIIKLDNIRITPDLFEAKAVREWFIRGLRSRKRPYPDEWEFSANWAYMTLTDDCLSSYSCWSIWPDPELVKKVEDLVKNEQFEEALQLTIDK